MVVVSRVMLCQRRPRDPPRATGSNVAFAASLAWTATTCHQFAVLVTNPVQRAAPAHRRRHESGRAVGSLDPFQRPRPNSCGDRGDA